MLRQTAGLQRPAFRGRWAASRRAVTCSVKAQPSFVTSLSPSNNAPGVPIQIIGVKHTDRSADLGSYIFDTKPAAVAVETALSPNHGSTPGAIASGADFYVSSDFQFLCQVAGQLTSEAEGTQGWQDTPTWKELSSGKFPAEQLAYAAALILGAPLVHCDRPKDITFKRLWAMPSIEDLDVEFGRVATSNYLAVLPESCNAPARAPEEPPTVSNRILMQEREAVMCSILEQWAVKIADGSSGTQSPNPNGPLVAIVGASHVPGLVKLWEDGSWQELAGDNDAREKIMAAPPVDGPLPAGDLGVRRALLERLLRNSAPVEVLQHLEATLGPIGANAGDSYAMTRELYSTCRMLLAMLPRELLPAVCGSYQCDMWEVLAPCRAVRPSLGGRGWSEELVMDLRCLYVEVG